MTLVIHCRNRYWRDGGIRPCRTLSKIAPAVTPCQDFSHTKQHINLCEWYLDRVVDGDQTPEQLASMILHEMFHVWGANEFAARQMELATGWQTPTI